MGQPFGGRVLHILLDFKWMLKGGDAPITDLQTYFKLVKGQCIPQSYYLESCDAGTDVSTLCNYFI